jgi:dTMP kinase
VTALGVKIRRLLKFTNDLNISPLAELLLFNASRAQLVTEVIRPALERGTVVVCDRYADSTTAYQGHGRGLDLTAVEQANKIGMQDLVPDLTVLLDISVSQGIARKKGNKADRFEKEDLDFHEKVRSGYLKIAKAGPKRWLVIDATKDKEEISRIVWDKVIRVIKKKQGA